MACLRARIGDPEAALHYLDIYEKAFISRNGFHLNGDQLKTGYSRFQYRPFTLEGNFLAAQAVHEMLLQSWHGVVRIFPATPERWRDASFEDLRAEGGFRVSARRENHQTTWIRIGATVDGTLRVLDNFSGRNPRWNRSNVRREGDCFVLDMQSGEILEGRFR
jgi:alpha-L-fucosidase 2